MKSSLFPRAQIARRDQLLQKEEPQLQCGGRLIVKSELLGPKHYIQPMKGRLVRVQVLCMCSHEVPEEACEGAAAEIKATQRRNAY